MRKSDGFTLVELLVGILCTAIVTGAAMTLMLMGARTNRALLDANSEQNTARIITTMVDKLASEGSIKTVVTIGDVDPDNPGQNDWALLAEDGSTILSYSLADKAIYSQANSVLMENVTASGITISPPDATITGRLLNFFLQTDNTAYTTSVFCRTTNVDSDSETKTDVSVGDTSGRSEDDFSVNMSASEETGRFKLLEILCGQYNSSGEIEPDTGLYFSEWYLKNISNDPNYTYSEHNSKLDVGETQWSTSTPWCACFVSWGINSVKEYLHSDVPCFANVESGKNQFESENHPYGFWYTFNEYVPVAGDLVFFNWPESPHRLDHVGVVFYTDANYIYTIEGNSGNDGVVALKRYPLTNNTNIVGYGVLNWK